MYLPRYSLTVPQAAVTLRACPGVLDLRGHPCTEALRISWFLEHWALSKCDPETALYFPVEGVGRRSLVQWGENRV
jgi:hypothetical protein